MANKEDSDQVAQGYIHLSWLKGLESRFCMTWSISGENTLAARICGVKKLKFT